MKTLRSITRFAIPALLCLSLAACGGGGGSSGTSTCTSPGSNTNGGNNTNGGGNNTNGGGSNTNGGGGTVTGGSTTPSFTVSGLATGFSGTLGLLDNGTDHLQLKQPGYFTFANSVSSGSSYDVTVAVQPPLQFCSATSASGKATGNVTNVLVGCSPGQFSIPYSFSSTGTGNVNTDGAGPVGGLAEGPDGTLYAATSRGGSAGNGAIIAYTPGAQGVSTILSFGGTGSAGATPDSGVVVTQASPGSLNLYGVAYSGGTSTASGYCGTVYNLYTEVPYLYLLQSLHDFNDTSDGCHPDSRLLLQSNQSFDGTALSGGVAGGGTLYNIAQSGAFTVLIDFPFSATTGGLAGPEFGLTEDDGIVYGVATQGGAAEQWRSADRHAKRWRAGRRHGGRDRSVQRNPGPGAGQLQLRQPAGGQRDPAVRWAGLRGHAVRRHELHRIDLRDRLSCALPVTPSDANPRRFPGECPMIFRDPVQGNHEPRVIHPG